jgi:large subunit ribosomal protein L3
MTIGLVGRKCGMTRMFNDEGQSVPVTVIQVDPNRITQIKTIENDGYRALQVTTGDAPKAHRIARAQVGHFAKAGVEAGRGMWEFRLNGEDGAELKVGDKIAVDIFEPGQKVDVTATSKGKGFAGVIKRWNFSMQDATHGNSLSHRAPGSIGQNQSPGRVFKGKKMAGHMGDRQVTTQSLLVVNVDAEKSLILVKGSVPGATGYDVIVRPAVKS